MICVKCRQAQTSVANSRPHKKHASVWRRRRCANCGYVFTTTESPLAQEQLEVVYGDGSGTPFSLPRLAIDLHGYLAHSDNPAETAYWLSETVYQTLLTRGNAGTAVPVHELMTLTHKVLDRFDALAGLQYAARYKILTTHKKPGRPRLK